MTQRRNVTLQNPKKSWLVEVIPMMTTMVIIMSISTSKSVNSNVITTVVNNSLKGNDKVTLVLTTNETAIDYHHNNNNHSQPFFLELREKKRQERLAAIKSQILNQLPRSVKNENGVNQDCSLTNSERNILNEIFLVIKKKADGTIDVNEFTTNPKIIEKLEALRPNAWTCVKSAIFDRPLNSLNSTLSRSLLFPTNSSNNIGYHLFDQSGLSNKSLSDYQNDNATQQHILEQRQRRRQERLIYIQNQILSRLGLIQQTNETLPPCKLTESERTIVNQLFTKSSPSTSTSSNNNENQISNTVFTKLQGFYASCKLNLISLDPNQPNNSLTL